MDRQLHAERLGTRGAGSRRMSLDDVPDGALLARDDRAFAVRGGSLLRWTPSGYLAREPRPRGAEVSVLTPPSVIRILATGYAPQWHSTALA